MSSVFDPYHLWLGIPPEEQPPNHYRLLGLKPFETKPAAIEHAADQRMIHLRTFQAGRHTAFSQKLLNEVSAARVCLLNPEKKANYDRQLRETARSTGFQPVNTQPPPKHGQDARATQLVGEPTITVESLPKHGQDAHATRLGEYELFEKLGEGGMGIVYRALHTKLGRHVAVKVLTKSRFADKNAIARFEREMKAVGAVDHPNIVRAMDAREIDGTRFLVTELIEGLDLRDIVRCVGQLPVADACELVRQAALALQSVEQHKLVHRDVKPSNLMLTRQGQVKLLDLGLARFQSGHPDEDEMTGTGQILGTLDYMAPEQTTDTHNVDIRADIYSLGCTLYKLLAGHAPFSDSQYKTPFEKMEAHLRKPPPKITRFRDDLPKELVSIIHRMIAKDPARRFRTPAEVADAVGPFAAGCDLPGLLAVAEHKPPALGPSHAMEETAASRSSGLIQFLQQLGVQSSLPGSKKVVRTKQPLIFGAAGVGLLLLIIAIFVGRSLLMPGPLPDPVLVFDWPADVREEVKLMIDGNSNRFPPSKGAIEHSCEPGEHRIVAQRPGYKRWEEVVQLEPGDRRNVSPRWLRQSYLVLQWPVAERRDAKMEIDGKEQKLSTMKPRPGWARVRVPLDAGPHKVRIVRIGFEPFEQAVTIVEGKDFGIKPTWEISAPVAEQEPVRSDRIHAVSPGVQPSKPDESGHDEQPQAEADIAKQEAARAKQEAEALAKQKAARVQKAAAKKSEEEATAAQRRREQRYTDAIAPAEAKIAEWDFHGAAEALEKVRFDAEPKFTARLAQRRDEVKRMAALKARMIAKINAEKLQLSKRDLMLYGIGGNITGADENAIAAKLRSGKIELHPWGKLNQKVRPKLLQLVIDPNNADDWLSAGVLALVCNDAALAEKLFAKAQSLGAEADRYLASLADTALAEANELLEKKEFRKAKIALADIEKKYAKTTWFASNRESFDATRAAVKSGIYESEAEELYAQAAKLLKDNEPFDLKPLVEKLKTDYADSTAVTDAKQKPSFVEMESVVAKLGKRITVRQGGKGDHKTIQTAINAAPPNSLIEIQDVGPYNEEIVIPKEKEGLTIRGKKDCWPIINMGNSLAV